MHNWFRNSIKNSFYVFSVFMLFSACEDKVKSTAEVMEHSQVVENKKAEDLKIIDFEGLKPYLNKTDDKTYIINFWATWCAPCVKELPYFEDITKQYRGNQVEVILVSLDFPRQFESKLKPFIKEKNLQSEVLALNDMDMNTWIPQVDQNWSGAIPATLIYNNNKSEFFEKSFTEQELQTLLKQFIN